MIRETRTFKTSITCSQNAFRMAFIQAGASGSIYVERDATAVWSLPPKPFTFWLLHPRCCDEHSAFITFRHFIKLRFHLLYDAHHCMCTFPTHMDTALILRIIPTKMGMCVCVCVTICKNTVIMIPILPLWGSFDKWGDWSLEIVNERLSSLS